jgi:tRNA-2-methylthio-N6-dimethylallyladenosine synthase
MYIATFGCQMNEYDSGRAARLMVAEGYETTDDPARADLIFINTCGIREKAELKVYSLLGRLKPLKEKNKGLVLAVGGCVAQQEGPAILDRAPYVDLVLGTHGLDQLPPLVREIREDRGRMCRIDFDYNAVRRPDSTAGQGIPGLKAYVTIMQGCDNFCAYCVVPYVRGREVSRQPDDVLAEAEALVKAGAREIMLLGQNVNSYGRGIEPKTTFPDLVRRVAAIPGLWRLRFTTSHPKDLSPELIRTMAEEPVAAEHLHLPVQAGSNAVLKAMGRGYTREAYLEKVAALREALPGLGLTTDVIVGFPGETEEDFAQTMDLIERVRYDGMYSFKYSDRPGTRATAMPDKVDPETAGRRLNDLQTRQKVISLEENRRLVGRRVEVLVESRGIRRPDQLTGRTRTHKIVNFVGPDHLVGRLVSLDIVSAGANSLLGVLPDQNGFLRESFAVE